MTVTDESRCHRCGAPVGPARNHPWMPVCGPCDHDIDETEAET